LCIIVFKSEQSDFRLSFLSFMIASSPFASPSAVARPRLDGTKLHLQSMLSAHGMAVVVEVTATKKRSCLLKSSCSFYRNNLVL